MKSDLAGDDRLKIFDRGSMDRCKMAKNLMFLNGHDGDRGNHAVVDCHTHEIGGNDADSKELKCIKKETDPSHILGTKRQASRDIHVGSGDAKMGKISQKTEVQHLKELLLLHLDVIQQQQDELRAKDRLAKTLQQEKEAVIILKLTYLSCVKVRIRNDD